MLMLNLYFESKKSEEIKVERFIGWSAIEPKPPRQQLTKTMSYTIKVIAEKYISQESESRKKRIMCSPLLLHPLQGSSCPGVDLLPQPPSMPRLGPDGLSSFSGRLVVEGPPYWCWLLTSPPLLGPCWARQLCEVTGDDNSSHCRLVPLYLSLGCPPWWMKQDSLVCLSSGWLCETGEKREKGKTDWHLGISDALLRRVAFAIPAIFFFVSKIACFLKNRALWPQRAWILPRWKSKRLYFLCVGQTTINWVIGYTGDQVIRYTGATARPMKRNTKHHWNWL